MRLSFLFFFKLCTFQHKSNNCKIHEQRYVMHKRNCIINIKNCMESTLHFSVGYIKNNSNDDDSSKLVLVGQL